MLFMGEEWGARTPFQFFTSFSDPELGEAVREGRTREFGSHGWDVLYGGSVEVPNPQDVATFEASKLDWAEAEEPAGARLLEFYRRLIRLRREVPEIASDDRSLTGLDHDPGDETWFVLHRGAAAVVVNLSAEAQLVPLAGADRRDMLLAWDPVVATAEGVQLTGHGVVLLGPARG
jgi:maltooligosyltrehalose trehalohydrolase